MQTGRCATTKYSQDVGKSGRCHGRVQTSANSSNFLRHTSCTAVAHSSPGRRTRGEQEASIESRPPANAFERSTSPRECLLSWVLALEVQLRCSRAEDYRDDSLGAQGPANDEMRKRSSTGTPCRSRNNHGHGTCALVPA